MSKKSSHGVLGMTDDVGVEIWCQRANLSGDFFFLRGIWHMHMEVPGLGIKWELPLLAYSTAIVKPRQTLATSATYTAA